MSYFDYLRRKKTTIKPYTNGKHNNNNNNIGKQYVYEEVWETDDEDEDTSFNSFRENMDNFLKKPELNEWTFTLIMFLFSFTIFLVKLFHYHDFFYFLDINSDNLNNSIPLYKNLTDKTIIEPFGNYYWFVKAVLSGLTTTGLAWFILYKDSNVPGVIPPAPFTPSKKRINPESPVLEFNYLVVGLIGLLIFLYMCL